MTEKYRPRLHFTPATGWMNDPNGLIEVDGVYHMFFQHDPQSINHGPMHWGHAVSTDLCHWTERPVALYPDELGTRFSGSALRTAEGKVKLFHTAHRQTADGKDFQTQCIVHAGDALERFEGDPANPVIDNPGLEAFRDPKVTWHAETARWIMAVTLGHAIGFYSSTDLLQWQFESSFEDERREEGVWECPDLLPMAAPDGRVAWVLIVSLASGAYAPGSGTRYYIGHFDGHRFASANPPGTDLWMDHGRDFYAPQTFFRTGLATPVAIAWASNWSYARTTPTTEFRGAMTLPRELRLVDTPEGLRLAQRVPEQVRQAFMARGQGGGTLYRSFSLGAAPGSLCSISLFGRLSPQLLIVRTGPATTEVSVHRTERAGMDGFGHDYAVTIGCEPGRPVPLELFVDRGMIELGISDGQQFITNLDFPDDPDASPSIVFGQLRRPHHAGRA